MLQGGALSFFSMPAEGEEGEEGRLHVEALGLTFVALEDAAQPRDSEPEVGWSFSEVARVEDRGASAMALVCEEGAGGAEYFSVVRLSESGSRGVQLVRRLVELARSRPRASLGCFEVRRMASSALWPAEEAAYQKEWALAAHHYVAGHFAAADLPHLGRLYLGFGRIAFSASALWSSVRWDVDPAQVASVSQDGVWVTFALHSGESHTVSVVLASRCVAEARELLAHHRANVLFGVPLAALEERFKGQLPPALETALAWMEACEPEEGMFRVPGSARAVAEWAFRADHGEEPPFDDINNAASCIKRFFLECPDDLLPADALQALEEDAASALASMHPYRRKLLARMCLFLERIAQHHEVSKMGLSNLALIFSPVFYSGQGQEDLVAAVQAQGKCGAVLTALITNRAALFEE